MSDSLKTPIAAVRRRVRIGLMSELVGRLIAVAAVLFWVGLLADRWFEPPPVVRQFAWGVTGVAALVWLGHTCLAPLCRRIPDRVIALWIERAVPELSESLTTALEHTDQSSEAEPTLVRQAQSHARRVLEQTDPSRVVSFHRPGRWLQGAFAGVGVILAFAVIDSASLGFYLKRLALAPEPWPRRVVLSIDGFAREADGRRVQRVAAGSSVVLVVSADLTQGHVAPPNVELRRRPRSGGRVDRVFSAVGTPTTGADAHQKFRVTVDRVDDESTLSIRGGDATLGPLYLISERRPQVVSVELEVASPEYLGGTTERIAIGAADTIPEGAIVTLHVAASKRLSQISATWQSADMPEADPLPVSATEMKSFQVVCPPLMQDAVIKLSLVDAYGIPTAEPYPISLAVEPDQLPRVALALRGIGPTVTPSVRLPAEVQVDDDHEAVGARLTIDRGELPAIVVPLAAEASSARLRASNVIDLMTLKTTDGAPRPAPGERLTLKATASDRYDLTTEPRESNSQQIELRVVTPERLLARLEQSEINLRQTFESTVENVRRATIALGRQPAVSDPQSDDAEPRLWAIRIVDELKKSTEETLAAAEAFNEIYLELENNRVPNEDLKDRIKSLIATPLKRIGESDLPEASRLVTALGVDPAQFEPAKASTRQALLAMESILEQMRSLENYNEVIAMLRQIIDEQHSLNEATQRSKKDGLRRLLLD